MTSPLSAIEQISFLLLVEKLSRFFPEADAREFREFPRMHWTSLRALPGELRFEQMERNLIPFLTVAIASPDAEEIMAGAFFAIPNARLLAECMEDIDRLGLEDQVPNAGGWVVEKLLDQLKVSGREGQFVTPRPLCRAMVDLVAPRPEDVVCDPTAGTAGFLVEAYRHRERRHWQPDGTTSRNLVGFDVNPTMVRLGTMNLLLHGAWGATVRPADSISDSFAAPRADVVLANPPFGAIRDPSQDFGELGVATTRFELLFLERCRQILTQAGRAAVVVPQSVLFGANRDHMEVRRRWLEGLDLRAVVTLPESAFAPHTRVRTAILFATRVRPTESVLFCPLDDSGFDQEELWRKLEHLPEAVAAVLSGKTPEEPAAQELTAGFFSVRAATIAGEDWILQPSRYRPQDQVEASSEDPEELLERAGQLESRLQSHLEEARRLLDRLQ